MEALACAYLLNRFAHGRKTFERAEDVFYVTDFENRPLGPSAAELLKERLVQALDARQAALRAPAAGPLRA